MNIVLLVVDSLRACSLGDSPGAPRTPFFDRLARESVHFRRAYATECWTLPAHCSMFTGLLASEHGAHFQTMGYAGAAPTIAELLSADGFHTEVVTRNSIFDGAILGITRGFRAHTSLLAEVGGLNPLSVLLALSKPRFRRQIRQSGFFHPRQRGNRDFVRSFARATVPADTRSLAYLLEQMVRRRRAGEPYFLFGNLYDVHAPYPPSPRSIFRSLRTLDGCLENLRAPFVLPCLGSHAYLKPGFRLSSASRRMLLGRYHAAIELMDQKLAGFYDEATRLGLLDDTLLVVTSDHGEGFGEHGLYLHDSSVYETHLHVPLFIHHSSVAPHAVDEVVSTRDCFGLLRAAAGASGWTDTILDPAYRAQRPIALAEHFHYPHAPRMAPQYRQDLVAAVAATRKLVVRREGTFLYDLTRDPGEEDPIPVTVSHFESVCRAEGRSPTAIDAVGPYLRRAERARSTLAALPRHPMPLEATS